MVNLKVKSKKRKPKAFFFTKPSTDSSNVRFCNLVLKQSRSNTFITLTDALKRVIICHTAGTAKVGRRKRRKISPHAIEPIMFKLKRYFIFYGIKAVRIILRIRPNIRLFVLVKELMSQNLEVKAIIDDRARIHGKMRSRKIRRV